MKNAVIAIKLEKIKPSAYCAGKCYVGLKSNKANAKVTLTSKHFVLFQCQSQVLSFLDLTYAMAPTKVY